MNACEKKIKKPIEKTRYPAGYPNPDFQNPGIRYPGSKSVSGTTLLLSKLLFQQFYSDRVNVLIQLELSRYPPTGYYPTPYIWSSANSKSGYPVPDIASTSDIRIQLLKPDIQTFLETSYHISS